MQHEWVEGRLTFLAGCRLADLVPRDPASVSSGEAGSSSLGRSVVVVPGSPPALGEVKTYSTKKRSQNLQNLSQPCEL